MIRIGDKVKIKYNSKIQRKIYTVTNVKDFNPIDGFKEKNAIAFLDNSEKWEFIWNLVKA